MKKNFVNVGGICESASTTKDRCFVYFSFTLFKKHLVVLVMCLIGTSYSGVLIADGAIVCNPFSIDTCGLPFPSDNYAKADEQSLTGIRLDLPNEMIRGYDSVDGGILLSQMPASVWPEENFKNADGYSPLGPVLFEFDRPIDELQLSTLGDEVVKVIDLTDGSLIPIQVRVSGYAKSDEFNAPSQVLEVWPRARWPYGRRLLAIVTDSLPVVGELGFTVPDAMLLAFDDERSDGQNNLTVEMIGQIKPFLTQQGIDKEHILNLTVFTVRSEHNVVDWTLSRSRQVYEQEHQSKVGRVDLQRKGDIAATVYGQVSITNFREEDGGVIVDLTRAGDKHWTDFILWMPAEANKEGKVPVSIYGHGITVNKETGSRIAESNAALGIATIAIDQPNHGSRSAEDGGYILDVLDPYSVQLAIGMINQSSIDQLSLLKAVRTSLSKLNVLPHNPWSSLFPWVAQQGGGLPDLDVDRVFYQATSMGGVFGATFSAVAPELEGAFLQVPGSAIINVIYHSYLWGKFFHNMMPQQVTGAEAMLFVAMMQQAIDLGDSGNFVHYFRYPPPGLAPRPLAVVYGLNDAVVHNPGSIAMAELAELPQLEPVLQRLDQLRLVDDFEDGYGVLQLLPYLNLGETEITDISAHMSFMRKEAQDAMQHWIRKNILEKDQN